MRKLVSLIALTGLLVTTGLSTPSLLYAGGLTKSRVKAGARRAGEKSKAKWESLSPEEQQKLTELAQQDEKKAKAKWESLSPEQQQEFKKQAKAGGVRLKKWWDQLPE